MVAITAQVPRVSFEEYIGLDFLITRSLEMKTVVVSRTAMTYSASGILRLALTNTKAKTHGRVRITYKLSIFGPYGEHAHMVEQLDPNEHRLAYLHVDGRWNQSRVDVRW